MNARRDWTALTLCLVSLLENTADAIDPRASTISRFFDVGNNLDTKCHVSDEHKRSTLFVRFIHILSKFRPTQSDVHPTKSPICLKFVPHVQAFVWCSSNLYYAMFGRTHWAAVLVCVRQGTGWSCVRPTCTNVSWKMHPKLSWYAHEMKI